MTLRKKKVFRKIKTERTLSLISLQRSMLTLDVLLPEVTGPFENENNVFTNTSNSF